MKFGLDQINRPAPEGLKWVAYASIILTTGVVPIVQNLPAAVCSQEWANFISIGFTSLSGVLTTLREFGGNNGAPPPIPPI